MFTDITAKQLLRCLRSPMLTEEQEMFSVCAAWPPEEWSAVVKLAEQTWVLPLLYGRLKEQALLPILPLALRQLLSNAYRQNALRNLRLFQTLLQLLQMLEGAGIPVLLLKGVHLANFVYADPALRTMGDVDILVAEEHLTEATKIMQAMGLQTPPGGDQVHRHHYHIRFTQPDTDVTIELHWHLHQPHGSAQIDLAALWANARAATLAGLPVRLLAPEDLLIHLAFHVAKHSFDYGGLRSSCDIVEVLIHTQLIHTQQSQGTAPTAHADFAATSSINWQLIAERVSAWSIQKQVHVALTLTNQLYHLGIPSTVLTNLQSPTFTQTYVNQAQAMILHPQEKKISSAYIQWWHSMSWGDRIELIRRSWLLPRAQLAAMYPVTATSLWIYMYYLVRLKDILQRYGLISLQMIWREQTIRQRIQNLGAFIPWLHAPE